jgi:hypothetical protein
MEIDMSIASVAASARRALAHPAHRKVKRGAVVVVENNSSSTDIHGKKNRYQYYFLAYAHRVNRQGIVTEWRKPDSHYSFSVDANQRILTIDLDAYQAAAQDICSRTFDNYFGDPQKVRDLVNDRVEALR